MNKMNGPVQCSTRHNVLFVDKRGAHDDRLWATICFHGFFNIITIIRKRTLLCVHTGIVTFSSILSICSSSEVTHCFKGIKINVCMYCTTVVHDALQIFKSTVFTDGQNFRGILNYFSSPLQSKAKFISASYISNLASVIVHVFMKGSSTLLWVTSKHSCEITRFFHRRT